MKNNIKINNANLLSTTELAKQLNTSNKVILENAKKYLPNKKIDNGKTTYWNEKEITVLLEGLKINNLNQHSFTGAVKVINTTLTPALKIKKAMELMQEGYEEELKNLQKKLEYQKSSKEKYQELAWIEARRNKELEEYLDKRTEKENKKFYWNNY